MSEHTGGDENEHVSAWPFVLILVGFKIWTLILILVMATSWDAVEFIIASHVLWLLIGAAVLWGPAFFWWRLVRARRRRAELQRAEWEVEQPRTTPR